MRGCRPALLVPVGFAAESVETEGDTATIRVRAVAPGAGFARAVGGRLFVFIVATIAAWRICPLVDEWSGSLSWRVDSIVAKPGATGGFSPSGSGNWHHGRAELRDWIPLFSILGWHSVVDQRQVLPGD